MQLFHVIAYQAHLLRVPIDLAVIVVGHLCKEVANVTPRIDKADHPVIPSKFNAAHLTPPLL
jgi:hypothetical protein